MGSSPVRGACVHGALRQPELQPVQRRFDKDNGGRKPPPGRGSRGGGQAGGAAPRCMAPEVVSCGGALWLPGQGPRADAMITRRPGVGLAIITADCAPGAVRGTRRGRRGACRVARRGWRECWRRWSTAMGGQRCACGGRPLHRTRPPTRSPPICATPCWRGMPLDATLLRRRAGRAIGCSTCRVTAPHRLRAAGAVVTLSGGGYAGGRRPVFQPSPPDACRRRPNRPSGLHHRMPYLPSRHSARSSSLMFVLFGCVLT